MARGRFTRDENGLRFRSFAGPGALLRPPGMLHLARSERRGWYYLGAGTTSGVAWWLSAEAARDADEQLQQAEQQFSMASGSADSATLAGLQAQVTTAREQQRDDHRIRDIWAIYFGAIWAGAGVEAWLMTPRATVASSPGEYLVTLPGTNGWRAAICSALVPGAGQRVLGRDGRASTFSTIIAATMAGAILAQDQVLAARRDYYAAKRQRDASPAGVDRFQVQAAMDDAESEEDAYSTLRSVMLGVAAPVYLWSVVDAFLGGRRAASVAAARRAPAVSLAPTVDGVRLALTLRLR
jgi:hypothetical protein